MFKEIAIEPGAVAASDLQFRYIIEKFGVAEGRLIAAFPSKWKKFVYQAAQAKLRGTTELSKIEVRLRNLTDEIFYFRGRPGDGCAQNWLAAALTERGLKIISGGTDSHVMLVDLRPKKATGVSAEKVLDRAGITANKNSIPGDPEKYTVTSGVRLGSPAGTTRGFGVAEFRQIGHLIADVLDGIAKNGPDGDAQVEAQVRGKVRALCERFPIYRD